MTKKKKITSAPWSPQRETPEQEQRTEQNPALTQATDLTVCKASGARFQFLHKSFLSDNDGSKSWMHAAWK